MVDKQPQQLATTTGFLDQLAIENETVCLSGWVLSFESEPVTNFKVLFGSKQLTGFALTQGLPSPGVKKAHPNISAANNARFIIRLPMNKPQQQEFKDTLIILIPLVKNRAGEPLLNGVIPALSSLVKTSETNNLPTTTPQVELISVHVPKAAGTAFRQVLLQVYGTQGVLTDKTNMFEDNMPATIHWQTKVIEGHFRAGKYDKLFPNAYRITWLREPIHRLISDYCFRHISNPTKEHLNKESLLKFAQGNSNLMAYCVNSKSLDYFDFIGITEHFAEDLLELKNILGWSDYEVIYQNRNPYPEYVEFQNKILSDKKIMDELAIANSQDMELYAAALKLRSEGRRKMEQGRSIIDLPEQNIVDSEEYPVTERTKLLSTLGSLDKAEFDQQQLVLTGWVVAPNFGAAKGFKLTVANTRIEKFETALNLPSLDVKKFHPNVNNSGQSRFRIKVPLNPAQISQFQNSQIDLTPIFKDGEGGVLSKVLGNPKKITFPEAPIILEQPKLIAPIKTITTLGYFDNVTISNQNLVISGWVGSYNFGSVKGFKISIAGQEITKFKHSLGLASPDIKKAFPKLAGAETARFQVTIPVSESEILEFQDSVLSLTPLFKDAKGKAIVKVVNFVGKTNKTVDYKIVDSHIILPDKTSIPFPPELLVKRVHGESEINGFLQIGLGISQDLKLALDKIGKKFSDFDSVLDFSCSCGRVMIWNYLLNKSTLFHGTDVDAEAISWCQENLKFAKFSVNQALPPTEYEDNKFDFVYLISVFSHINEEMQLQWLQELRRITKPEGIVMITTRGPNIPREAYDLTTKLEKEGLLFFTSPDKNKVFPDWYQTTYQTEDYIRNKWVSEFEIIDFIPGGIRASQDIVILKNNHKIQEQLEPTLLPTTGYLEYIALTDKKELSIRGWVAAVDSGTLENMKVFIAEREIQNFQLKKAIPSPDVKKNNSHLDAETARFELSIPLSSEQLEQYRNSDISLTPFFQKGEGTAISKRLAISIPQAKNEKETVEVSDKQVKLIEASPSPALPKDEKVAAETLAVPQLQSSEFLTQIMADLEKSQTEIQEIQADLEKFKSSKKNTPTKNIFPVEPETNLSELEEQTSTKKKFITDQIEVDTNLSELAEKTPAEKKNLTKPVAETTNFSESETEISTAKKAPTKPVEKVTILPELGNKTYTEKEQKLLGLSGVTVEKFWEIINPVIFTEGKRDVSQPAISILTPTWNSSLDWFVETVLSVLKQSIINWEWCIVDDCSKQEEIKNVLAGLAEKEPRIKVLLSEENGNISAATNKALKMATGEFICMLDHDDTLAPTALEDSLNKLVEGFDVVYSDEDKIDFYGLNYIHPFFKPDWSPEYFRGVMYVGHLLCVRREIALAVGGFNSEFDGVQDYEFMLRVSEQTNKIAHISKHLYHWRQVQGSISGDTDAKAGIEVAQQAAINAHLERIGLAAKAEPGLGRHRVNINPLPRNNYPLISLIIAIPNISENLNQWLKNFLSVSTYPENEVILIGGNGTDNLIQNPAVKVLSLSGKFNYSRGYNLAAKTAKGEYFVFLNTNLKPAVEDWQRHLLHYAEQSDIGAVGGFLVFPNGTVEHAGIVLGKLGKVNYVMRGFPTNDDGYAGSLVCAREVSAVSRDCLMVSRENFELVGGFNEHFFYDYQDVDLCLKLRKKGKQIIFTPRSVLINNESEKHRQANYDVVDYMLLLDKWQIDMDLGDPYYNVNFDIQQNNYSVVV